MSRGNASGLAGYARLYVDLVAAPATATAFRERNGLSRTGAYAFIIGLHKLRRLRIVGWEQDPGRTPVPVYAVGLGVDVPPPARTPKGRLSKRDGPPMRAGRCSPALVAFEYVLRALESDRYNAADLAEAAAYGIAPIRAMLRVLHAAKLVHIAAWEREPNSLRAAYAYGRRPDAPKPPRTSRKVINARYWQKRQASATAVRLQSAAFGLAGRWAA